MNSSITVIFHCQHIELSVRFNRLQTLRQTALIFPLLLHEIPVHRNNDDILQSQFLEGFVAASLLCRALLFLPCGKSYRVQHLQLTPVCLPFSQLPKGLIETATGELEALPYITRKLISIQVTSLHKTFLQPADS